MIRKIILPCLLMVVVIVLAACSFSSRSEAQPEGEISVDAAQSAEGDTGSAQSSSESGASEAEEPQESAAPSDFNTGKMEDKLSQFVLRNEDLPDEYRLPPNGEYIISTGTLINEMKELPAKRYVLETGRVNGWGIQLERVNKEDFAPSGMQSQIQLFETSQGAALAISPEWHPAYSDEVEVSWVDGGCDIGDECLFYFTETYEAASQITKLRYEVAFAYRNVVVWVMGHGLDVDVTPEYILNAAQALYEKLDQYAQSQ